MTFRAKETIDNQPSALDLFMQQRRAAEAMKN